MAPTEPARHCRTLLASALALVLPVVGTAHPAAAASTIDRCSASASMLTGPSAAGYYTSIAPFEHHDSGRSQVFSDACSLRELPPGDGVEVRTADGDYATPYVVSTRDRDQVVLYGYSSQANTTGAFVTMLDAGTLTERWRVSLRDTTPKGQWSYPGVAAVIGDGAVVAVYGNQLFRLDAATGQIVAQRSLPEDPSGTGAAYNGFVALDDGTLVLKNIERGRCPLQHTNEGPLAFVEAFGGLLCASHNELPTALVTVDPRTLRVLDTVTTPEPVTGRVTSTRRHGVDLVYVAGQDSMRRYVVRPGGQLTLDEQWGPVRYRSGSATPGTGPGILGDWVVVQTNFLPSREAMQVTAINQDHPEQVFRMRPFADLGTPLISALSLSWLGNAFGLDASTSSSASWMISKPALDPDSMTIVTHDMAVGAIAAIHLDPRSGLKVTWRKPLRSLSFSALTGPAGCRDIVQTDWRPAHGDQVVWLDLATGRELRRTKTLDPLPAPGNIVTPGFDGTFYYAGLTGNLTELRPDGLASADRECRR